MDAQFNTKVMAWSIVNVNQLVDKITLFLLKESGLNYKVRDFHTCGSDERQYNYPGIDLNIGSLMKTKYGEFNEYHTSADNLEFVTQKGLEDSFNFYVKCIDLIDINHFYKNNILCEPFLSKYGLFNDIGALKGIENIGEYCRRILYYCDGDNDLINIYKILHLWTFKTPT